MSKEQFQPMIHQFQHLCAQIDPTADFSHRYMFGGVGLYTKGVVFGTLMGLDDSTISVALKLPVDQRDGLESADPLPDAPGGGSYATLPPRLVDDEPALMEWLGRSLAHTQSLMAKKSARKPRSHRVVDG